MNFVFNDINHTDNIKADKKILLLLVISQLQIIYYPNKILNQI